MLVLIKADSVMKADMLQTPLAYLLRIWLLYCNIKPKKTLISHLASCFWCLHEYEMIPQRCSSSPSLSNNSSDFWKASVQHQIEILAARQDTIWMIKAVQLIAVGCQGCCAPRQEHVSWTSITHTHSYRRKLWGPGWIPSRCALAARKRPVSRKSDSAAEASAGLRSVRISPGWNGNFILQGLILARASGKFLLNDHKLRKSEEFV